MKKIYLMLLVVAVSVSSCKKEEVAKPELSKPKVTMDGGDDKGGEDRPKPIK